MDTPTILTPTHGNHGTGGKKRKRTSPLTSTAASTSDSIVHENDTCSVTSSTATMTAQHTHSANTTAVFDAVIDEVTDLLAAAHQAQTLGRLKAASTYLLLSHARLLGLGRRFDRAVVDWNNGRPIQDESSSMTEEQKKGIAIESELRRYIPSEVELDNTMLEHLARAAMELHNKRTGRKSSTSFNSVVVPELFPNAALGAEPVQAPASSMTSVLPQNPEKESGSVAWTQDEKEKCRLAAEKYGRDDVSKIVSALGGSRSETQVRAHLKNVMGREKVLNVPTASSAPSASKVEGPGTSNVDGVRSQKSTKKVGSAKNHNTSKKAKKGGKTSSVHADDDENDDDDERDDDEDDDDNAPTKRGGRGKKLPPTAVHTVPNARFDARSIIMSSVIKSSSQTSDVL